jgi:DNA primase
MAERVSMDFAEQVKSSVRIEEVVGEVVRLRKSGTHRYMGLCPFHNEKSPSFTVHVTLQIYKCFSCGEGGDVFSFVMKTQGVSFFEALKLLAERHGIPMPKRSQYADEDARKRGALFQLHELAQENFRANLRGPAGETARNYLARRGLSAETIEHFGLGYSDRSGRALLRLFEQRDFSGSQMEESGLAGRRQDGSLYDRFRNRLMFPIHNESGKIIGFGGRALADDDQPKYLNSPETPIYKKSHVLYNLHRAKDAIRKEDRVILVEGYMDAIGVSAAGFAAVVASCGTALTAQHVQALKRHTQRILVNFDPDAPGANAAERSINTLLAEGMHARMVELDGGLDPDEYCRERGAEAYQAKLDGAKGYFYWLADRARNKYDIHAGGCGGSATDVAAGHSTDCRSVGAVGASQRCRRLYRGGSRAGAGQLPQVGGYAPGQAAGAPQGDAAPRRTDGAAHAVSRPGEFRRSAGGAEIRGIAQPAAVAADLSGCVRARGGSARRGGGGGFRPGCGRHPLRPG